MEHGISCLIYYLKVLNSIRRIKFNVFFLIEGQNLMLCFWRGDLNKPLDLRVVSCQKMLVKLHVSHLNECLYQFCLEKGNFLQTVKAKVLSRTHSADREICRLICDVIRHINSGTDYWDFMHAYSFVRAGLLIFCAVVEPQNSSKSTKFTKTRKIS